MKNCVKKYFNKYPSHTANTADFPSLFCIGIKLILAPASPVQEIQLEFPGIFTILLACSGIFLYFADASWQREFFLQLSQVLKCEYSSIFSAELSRIDR